MNKYKFILATTFVFFGFAASLAASNKELAKIGEVAHFVTRKASAFRVGIYVIPRGVSVDAPPDRYLELVQTDYPLVFSITSDLWNAKLAAFWPPLATMIECRDNDIPAPKYVLEILGPWGGKHLVIGLDDINKKVLFRGKVYEMKQETVEWINKYIEPPVDAIMGMNRAHW